VCVCVDSVRLSHDIVRSTRVLQPYTSTVCRVAARDTQCCPLTATFAAVFRSTTSCSAARERHTVGHTWQCACGCSKRGKVSPPQTTRVAVWCYTVSLCLSICVVCVDGARLSRDAGALWLALYCCMHYTAAARAQQHWSHAQHCTWQQQGRRRSRPSRPAGNSHRRVVVLFSLSVCVGGARLSRDTGHTCTPCISLYTAVGRGQHCVAEHEQTHTV
jgi:hypothetical protein